MRKHLIQYMKKIKINKLAHDIVKVQFAHKKMSLFCNIYFSISFTFPLMCVYRKIIQKSKEKMCTNGNRMIVHCDFVHISLFKHCFCPPIIESPSN